MARLREVPRTAAFAWSTSISTPLLATGTRAGAVDADFSNETQLELWDVNAGAEAGSEPKPLASIPSDSRFFDLAWSQPNKDHPEGIIAGALENGSLDLWDAAKLKTGASDALICRVSKHSGAIKALQFNPHRPELLASSGAKGELYITDLNNPQNPFRVGTAAARSDDFDCLDWNKKVPHILVTGSSAGFVTVWDIKAKKESLTLNNYGRKPVSAVAWNPDVPTKLATAIPTDQDPLILMWDLRNSSAPERILKGHDQGVLSLAWSAQDSDLLLSCGKDNRTICWNPHTGAMFGEFPIVTNWTFQTRWNPRHPDLCAVASFDGKLTVHSIQNTNVGANESSNAASQLADDADFFAKAQSQPQTASFSLPKAPKWTRRPAGASFGFGGKLAIFKNSEETPQNATVKITTFVSDTQVESSISEFKGALGSNDVSQICDKRVQSAPSEPAREDWKVIKALMSESPRKALLAYLGFQDAVTSKSADGTSDGKADEDHIKAETNGDTEKASNRLSAFFDNGESSQGFLADLAASKGARTNNPFQIYKGSESTLDKDITKALMLGSFEHALDLCLKENRISDAFMIAICGGQKCIDKVQTAYFAQKSEGPNYLRLLASVVGKNLWDVVYNAGLENWAEVMATLCTYADQTEFPDLCEALGDRLSEDDVAAKKDAAFCYLAGSKLDKVIPIWIGQMQSSEKSAIESSTDDSEFSIHVQALQSLIEKVSVFRRATKYDDKDGKEKTSDWKLDPLYVKYAEYADVVASHGHLDLAQQFLDLLPAQYPAAEVARNRIKQASKKAGAVPVQRAQKPVTASAQPNVAGLSGQTTGYAQANTYAPAGFQQATQVTGNPYAPQTAFGGYAPQAPNLAPAPQPSMTAPPTGPSAPPKNVNGGGNWNDLPENFASKPGPSRRGTPGPGPAAVASPFPNQPSGQYGFAGTPPASQFPPSKPSTPLPPPPKAGVPPRVGSPLVDRSSVPQRPPSAAANAYAPQPGAATSAYTPASAPQTMSPPMAPPARGASPYNAPPATAPSTNRYAPAPGSQPSPVAGGPPMGNMSRQVAPNPYMAQQPGGAASAYTPSGQQTPASTRAPVGPPPMGPPAAAARGPPSGPPRGPTPSSSGPPPSTAAPRHLAGDRSHIPPESAPIYETLNKEMQRIKSRAPSSYKAQVDDTEKRLNLLFDNLNNSSINQVLPQLRQLSDVFQQRNFDQATALHGELTKQGDQGGSAWMVGVKRLIAMSKATPL